MRNNTNHGAEHLKIINLVRWCLNTQTNAQRIEQREIAIKATSNKLCWLREMNWPRCSLDQILKIFKSRSAGASFPFLPLECFDLCSSAPCGSRRHSPSSNVTLVDKIYVEGCNTDRSINLGLWRLTQQYSMCTCILLLSGDWCGAKESKAMYSLEAFYIHCFTSELRESGTQPNPTWACILGHHSNAQGVGYSQK